MANGERILVEVAYAAPDRQIVLHVEVAPGATVEAAIRQSHIADQLPELDVDAAAVGIFGRRVKRDRVVEPGDRVEIYRPLEADPKEVRRQLAALGKSMGRRRDS